MANYYAVTPADIRYNKNLTANAKLLYSEITSLCNADGFCLVDKKYFAKLYDVSTTSITRWLNLLVCNGHIMVTPMDKKSSEIIIQI